MPLEFMSSKHDKKSEAIIALAKATAEYRSFDQPLKRAVYLHLEHGITQQRAADEESISRASLRRALSAVVENREVGMNGRPRYLKRAQEEELKCKILQRSSSLDAMSVREICESVRTNPPLHMI